MAMALKANGRHNISNYDSDDDYLPPRLPFLKHNAQPSIYSIPDFSPNNNTCWNEGIHH